jgi:DNA-binding MarR family transcriptional regulator
VKEVLKDPLRSFGFLLKDVSRLYVQRFEQRAVALGLTLPQCKALVYLARREGISQVQLSESMDIDPMTLVRILDRMESEGLLERRADPADRRARCLYLKDKAKPLLDDIWRLSDVTRCEAFAGVTRQRADLLIALLDKVRGNLAGLETLPSEHPAGSAVTSRGRGGMNVVRARRKRGALRP